MATYDTVLSNSDYILRLIVNQSSQNITNNTSSVAWSLRIIKGSGSGKWSFYTKTWSVNIGGQTASGSISGYDFRNYTELILGSGSFTITHNADGTKTISNSGSFSEAQINVGNGTASGNLALTTIPRASTPTFSVSSVDAGVAFTINTNRASTSFTHTVRYAFGSLSGTIATGVATSQAWTPPLSLINEIPSATSGVLTIYLDTYSGSTLIGTKSGTLTLKVPTSIVPDFTTITVAEAVAAVTTVMGSGVYVQNQSKLSLDITGAVGAYGSTIPSTGYKIQTSNQTISAQSGVTPSPISTSGTAVVITGTVTDSRGRTKTKTVTINVLPWAPPVLNAPVTFRRALSNGTLADEGTYIRIDLNASVSSLINSTERNTLTYKVYSRTRGSSVWDIINTTTPAGLTFNSYILISPYSISTAYEVRVEVIDKFDTTAAEGTVATAAIFMHWGDGLGLGKYYESGRGTVDAIGQMYQNDGQAVLDASDINAAGGVAPYALIATKLGTAAPSTYPIGQSILSVGSDSTWPADFLTVVTERYVTGRTAQRAHRKGSGQTWTRNEGDSDTWGAWFESAGPGGDTSYGLGMVKIKPTGGTNITIAANGDILLNSAADQRIYGCFPPEFRWFRIVFLISTASQAGVFTQLINGATVDTTTNYDSGAASNGAGTTFAGATYDNDNKWIMDGGASGHYHQGSVDIMDPNYAGATYYVGHFGTRRTSTPSLTSSGVRSGLHQLGTAYNGFRFYASTGTQSGRVQIYGYR